MIFYDSLSAYCRKRFSSDISLQMYIYIYIYNAMFALRCKIGKDAIVHWRSAFIFFYERVVWAFWHLLASHLALLATIPVATWRKTMWCVRTWSLAELYPWMMSRLHIHVLRRANHFNEAVVLEGTPQRLYSLSGNISYQQILKRQHIVLTQSDRFAYW